MKCVFILFYFASIFAPLSAQILEDLTNSDNHRPYLTESQKQEQIQRASVGTKYTSQELYPNNYKYVKTDHLGPLKGTEADPANAFTNYANSIGGTNQPKIQNQYPGIPPSIYQPNLSIQQRNQQMIDADIAEYEAQKKRQAQLIEEAVQSVLGPVIRYNLGTHRGTVATRFTQAHDVLRSMMNGTSKIDFLKAVWSVENAVDPTLTWEDFSQMFNEATAVIIQLMQQEGRSPNDNMAKLMTIFKYMTDTTEVYLSSKEKRIVTKPMLYDYDDYAGRLDPTKVFVSKLLKSGTGQCMSLPMLYYLFAKELGADASIAFAPDHSYITFQDALGNRQNIELTGRVFATEDFYWQSGFIKAEQVKSGIYLRPLSETETLAYLLTTLSLSYIKIIGSDDNSLDMALTAREYFPNSLTANMIIAGYTQDLWRSVLRQYTVHGLTDKDLMGDKSAQLVLRQKAETRDHIMKNLGWSKMPEWAYKQWQDGVNELAMKEQHLVKMRQLEQQLNK